MKFDIRETAREQKILCAHRGVWGGNIPCNNIVAYDFAISEGADMVEIDVTKTADGGLFVFHPGTERRQLCLDIDIRKMKTEDVRDLKLCSYDGCPTHIKINTLDEVLEHLKGRVYINVDKFGANPAEIIEVIRRHDMKDQIVLKCGPQKNRLEIVETYAPDIPFLVVISEDNGCHEMLKNMNINYIGAELLFKTEDDEVATEKYRQTLRNDDKLLWVNTIVYHSDVVLAAGHSDDAAVSGDPEFGWGWCADRFDILQTDWVGQCSRYLTETGRRYNK